jgi:hypothetical protein
VDTCLHLLLQVLPLQMQASPDCLFVLLLLLTATVAGAAAGVAAVNAPETPACPEYDLF